MAPQGWGTGVPAATLFTAAAILECILLYGIGQGFHNRTHA